MSLVKNLCPVAHISLVCSIQEALMLFAPIYFVLSGKASVCVTPPSSVIRWAHQVELVRAPHAARARAPVPQVPGHHAGQVELGGAAGAGVAPADALLLQHQAQLLQVQVLLHQAVLHALQVGELLQVTAQVLPHHLGGVVPEQLPLPGQLLHLEPVVVQEAAQVPQLHVLLLQPLVDDFQFPDLQEVSLQLFIYLLDQPASLDERWDFLGLLFTQPAHQLLFGASQQILVRHLWQLSVYDLTLAAHFLWIKKPTPTDGTWESIKSDEMAMPHCSVFITTSSSSSPGGVWWMACSLYAIPYSTGGQTQAETCDSSPRMLLCSAPLPLCCSYAEASVCS